jgi:hypothetical protein
LRYSLKRLAALGYAVQQGRRSEPDGPISAMDRPAGMRSVTIDFVARLDA